MKTTTVSMMVIAFFMMTGLTFAGETATDMAKKELYHDIKECFQDDIKEWDNFFYQNGINRMDEKLQVCVFVNGDQSLSVIRIRSENPDAKDYVKHVFNTQELEAGKVLVGKAYVFNLSVRYIAK